MKLLQNLMEEKATNQQILKIIGRFLISLEAKVDQTNTHLSDLKEILKGTPIIEKQIIMETVVSPDSAPETKLTVNPTTDFIPQPDETHMTTSAKKSAAKKKKTKKNYTKKAALLKEDS